MPFASANRALFVLFAAVLLLPTPARGDCLIPYWQKTTSVEWAADALTTADIDADGKADAVGNTASAVFVQRSSAGQLQAPVTVYSGTVRGRVVPADWDGDGDADLALAGPSSLIVLPNNGNGTFGNPLSTAITISPSAIAAAYVNAGGAVDLIAYDKTTGVIAVFANNGGGTFTEASRLSAGVNANNLVSADFDGDGSADFILTFNSSNAYQIFYGHGDGTFDAAKLVWAASYTNRLRVADMTRDGLPDLVAFSDYYSTIVIHNLGGRAFGDPLYYAPYYYAYQYDLATGDLTGDSIPDVAVAESCQFHMWDGGPNGTLTWYSYNFDDSCYGDSTATPGSIALGDFDGDGRSDIVVSFTRDYTHRFVESYRNLCGNSLVTLTTESPTISVGQPANLNVYIGAPPDQFLLFYPTSDFTIKEGSTILATVHPSKSSDLITRYALSGLSLGDHTLTVSYPGDDQYDAADSAPLTIHVTNATTTTSITMTPASGVYSQPSTIAATVTSSSGDTPTGPLRFYVDGLSIASATAPTSTRPGPSNVGTHAIMVVYAGDATHPPSSASLNYVVSKQTPSITLNPPSAAAGTAQSLSVGVLSQYSVYSTYPSGQVTVSEGATTLGSATLTGWPYVSVTMPAHAAGRYDLHVVYAGDANFAQTDAFVPFVVFPSGSSSIDARGTTDAVTVTWYSPNQPIVARRRPDQAWGQGGGMCCSSPPWLDTFVQPETVYLYRMEAYDHLSFSNIDVGMRIGFTDENLIAGMTIKAVHLTELLRATNILRTAAGLPALTLNGIAAGQPVTAADVNALRDGINQARVALGAYAFPFSSTIAPGTTIRASDIREMREAVR